MLRRSTLSPFRLSAASAISNLKSITASASSASKRDLQFVVSATKRRKLSLPSCSAAKAGPDSDLKAAASALAVLAGTTSQASGPCATAACDVKRVLLPRDDNEIPTVTRAVDAHPPSSEAEPPKAPLHEAKASFHLGKPPLKPSAHSSKGASKVTARHAGQPSKPLPTTSHAPSSVGYPTVSYYPSSMHAQRSHREYHHPHHPPHYPSLSRSSTAMMSTNPAGWMWPTMHHGHQSHSAAWSVYPSASHPRHHHYHHHAAATVAAAVAPASAIAAPVVSTSNSSSHSHTSVNLYARAQGKPGSSSTSSSGVTYDLPPVDRSTYSAIAALPVKYDTKGDREWTAEDDRRLAQLVSDYKNRSRPAATTTSAAATTTMATAGSSNNKRSFDALVEASAAMEEEEPPLSLKSAHAESMTTVHSTDAVDEDDDGNFSSLAAKVVRRKRTTWTEDEDKELSRVVKALRADTDKVCWSTVMKMMPGRDSKQCRDRYLNHLDPQAIHNKSAWSEEEDRILLKFIKKHGTRWRLMQATVLPNRTELTIKNRWNSAMKRRYTRFLSKRWGVNEDSIRLLTTRGLLNPGVDIEQMLRVARCKMIDVAYNVGDVKSSREEILSAAPASGADQCAQDDISLVLQKYERSSHDIAAPIQVRVLVGKMAEVDAAHQPIGVLETLGVNSFAFLRAFLVEKYRCLAGSAFRFSVNHLGIISLKQEIDLGPIGAVLKALATGKGTAEEPFELLVVD
jgi:Myb-like DNA-binding domain